MPSVIRIPVSSSLAGVAATDGALVGWTSTGTLCVIHGRDGRVPPAHSAEWRDIVAIAANDRSLLALRADGRVVAWGLSAHGVLGEAPIAVNEPAFIDGLPPVAEIALSCCHAIARSEDGSVWCWGCGTHGELGHEIAKSRRPLRVPGIDDAIAVAAGWGFSLAVGADGRVRAWGSGLSRPGDEGDPPAARAIEGLTHVRAVRAGQSHALALTNTGEVFAWGDAEEGQLGPLARARGGSRKAKVTTPIRVPLPGRVIAVAACEDQSAAVTDDGRAWAWGSFDGFEAGLPRDVPTRLRAQSPARALALVPNALLVLATDGSLTWWGSRSWLAGNGDEAPAGVESVEQHAPPQERCPDSSTFLRELTNGGWWDGLGEAIAAEIAEHVRRLEREGRPLDPWARVALLDVETIDEPDGLARAVEELAWASFGLVSPAALEIDTGDLRPDQWIERLGCAANRALERTGAPLRMVLLPSGGQQAAIAACSLRPLADAVASGSVSSFGT